MSVIVPGSEYGHILKRYNAISGYTSGGSEFSGLYCSPNLTDANQFDFLLPIFNAGPAARWQMIFQRSNTCFGRQKKFYWLHRWRKFWSALEKWSRVTFFSELCADIRTSVESTCMHARRSICPRKGKDLRICLKSLSSLGVFGKNGKRKICVCCEWDTDCETQIMGPWPRDTVRKRPWDNFLLALDIHTKERNSHNVGGAALVSPECACGTHLCSRHARKLCSHSAKNISHSDAQRLKWCTDWLSPGDVTWLVKSGMSTSKQNLKACSKQPHGRIEPKPTGPFSGAFSGANIQPDDSVTASLFVPWGAKAVPVKKKCFTSPTADWSRRTHRFEGTVNRRSSGGFSATFTPGQR